MHYQPKILISPDKFKYSLTGTQISQIITRSLPNHFRTESLLLGDGGEGSLEAIKDSFEGKYMQVQVHDPLLRIIKAYYYLIPQKNMAFIQMARASGLQLLKNFERNPLQTSSYGTGQLIRDALNNNAKKIILLIGGSATNDGGTGMAQALGYRFYGADKKILKAIGANLHKIQRIESPDLNLSKYEFEIISDVQNVLCGPDGASKVYGPQKGATKEQIQILDGGLLHLDEKFQEFFKQSFRNISGSGAAGGLGAGGMAFLNAKIKSGIDAIMEMVDFKKKAEESDLLITGQGKLDEQTLNGKTVKGVLNYAKLYQKPVIIFCGKSEIPVECVGKNVEIIPLMKEGMTEQESIEKAEILLQEAVRNRFKDQF